MNYYHFSDLFDVMHYPAGESHVQMKRDTPLNSSLVIEANIRNFEDIGNLLTAEAILRRQGVLAEWFIPYMPFARHDRKNHKNDGLEIQIAAQMLGEVQPIIVDPHSDVTAGMFRHIPQSAVVRFLKEKGIIQNHYTFVIPDQGATKKAHTWLGEWNYVQGYKLRNPATGKLSGFSVASQGSGHLTDETLIIIDDICDGGGTFLGLVEKLRQEHPKSITLFTTHGLYTKGTGILSEFDRIISFGKSVPGIHRLSFEELFRFAHGEIV